MALIRPAHTARFCPLNTRRHALLWNVTQPSWLPRPLQSYNAGHGGRFTLKQRNPRIASGQQPSWTHRLHAQIYGHEKETGRGRHEMENSKPTHLSIPLTPSYTPHSPLMYSAISKGWVCVSTYLYLYLPPPRRQARYKTRKNTGTGRARHINQARRYALVNASFLG